MITSNNYHYLHRLAKRTVPILHKKNRFDLVMDREKNGDTNQLISEMIKSGKPFMVGRLGSTETRFLVNQSLQKKIGSDFSGIAKTFVRRHQYSLEKRCRISRQPLSAVRVFPQRPCVIRKIY